MTTQVTKKSGTGSDTLLHGAKGLDLGDTVLVFAKDKLVATPKGTRQHFTVHFGPRSKVLDIHQTCTALDGSITRTPLFRISHTNLAAMMQEVGLAAEGALRGILRGLRPGWMMKHRIVPVVGLVPTGSDIPGVTKVRRRKLTLDPGKLAARTRIPEFLEQLYLLPDGQAFTLFSLKNPGNPHRIGLGFKFTDPSGRRCLLWVRERSVAQALKHLGPILQNFATKYGTFLKPLPWG